MRALVKVTILSAVGGFAFTAGMAGAMILIEIYRERDHMRRKYEAQGG